MVERWTVSKGPFFCPYKMGILHRRNNGLSPVLIVMLSILLVARSSYLHPFSPVSHIHMKSLSHSLCIFLDFLAISSCTLGVQNWPVGCPQKCQLFHTDLWIGAGSHWKYFQWASIFFSSHFDKAFSIFVEQKGYRKLFSVARYGYVHPVGVFYEPSGVDL